MQQLRGIGTNSGDTPPPFDPEALQRLDTLTTEILQEVWFWIFLLLKKFIQKKWAVVSLFLLQSKEIFFPYENFLIHKTSTQCEKRSTVYIIFAGFYQWSKYLNKNMTIEDIVYEDMKHSCQNINEINLF